MRNEMETGRTTQAIHYIRPSNWIKYDPIEIASALTDAKAAILSLTTIPYQRSWAEKLQDLQLKREGNDLLKGTRKS